MAHQESSQQQQPNRFVDIGANILDDRYQGIYRGTERHDPDLDLVLERAEQVGVRHMVVTAGTLQESRQAVEFCKEWNEKKSTGIHFSCTVGVHPTRCRQEFLDNGMEDEEVLKQLVEIAMESKQEGVVVAIGEIGLDYDRLEFCPKDIQQKYLVRQLQVLAKAAELPLFLHNRNVGSDLYDILMEHQDCWKRGGVVHSFDDTIELASKFLETGSLYVGLNGCSLRTEENLKTVAELPLNRLLIETDCPYCDIRKTHAGFSFIQTTFDAKAEKKFEMGHPVKNRQEPCHVVQVAEVVAGVHQKSLAMVANTIYQNSLDLFG